VTAKVRVNIYCIWAALLGQGGGEDEGSHGGGADEEEQEGHCRGQQDETNSHGIGQEGGYFKGQRPCFGSPAGLCNVAKGAQTTRTRLKRNRLTRLRRFNSRSDSHGSNRGEESPSYKDEVSNGEEVVDRVVFERAEEDDELAAAILESANMAVVEQAADEKFHRDVAESQALSQSDADVSLELEALEAREAEAAITMSATSHLNVLNSEARQMELAIGFSEKHCRKVFHTVPNGEDQLIIFFSHCVREYLL
jgi:hypothetical protein